MKLLWMDMGDSDGAMTFPGSAAAQRSISTPPAKKNTYHFSNWQLLPNVALQYARWGESMHVVTCLSI